MFFNAFLAIQNMSAWKAGSISLILKTFLAVSVILNLHILILLSLGSVIKFVIQICIKEYEVGAVLI